MEKSKAQKVICVFGVILGIVCIILATQLNFSSGYVSWKEYGGDAYTGIQNAAAATANNVDSLGDFLEEATSMFFIVMGVGIILISLYKLFQKSSTPQVVCEAPAPQVSIPAPEASAPVEEPIV